MSGFMSSAAKKFILNRVFFIFKDDFFAFFYHLTALIKLDFDMEKSLQGHLYLFQKMCKCPIYTVELDLVEYLFEHYLKVIFRGLRNAKWPYLDLFCCLETFRHLSAVGMAGIIFLALDEGNRPKSDKFDTLRNNLIT
jgi:hypothetical protein